jgi:hypothetical protein
MNGSAETRHASVDEGGETTGDKNVMLLKVSDLKVDESRGRPELYWVAEPARGDSLLYGVGRSSGLAAREVRRKAAAERDGRAGLHRAA